MVTSQLIVLWSWSQGQTAFPMNGTSPDGKWGHLFFSKGRCAKNVGD
jgi:hypothetical protein